MKHKPKSFDAWKRHYMASKNIDPLLCYRMVKSSKPVPKNVIRFGAVKVTRKLKR